MRARRGTPLLAVAVASLVTSACSNGSQSVLHARSEATRRVAGLWWLTFWISVVVVAFVTVMILVSVRRGRAHPAGDEIDRRIVPWGERFIVIAGLVVSGAILAGTFAFSLRALNALASPPTATAFTIDVIGHDWWWEARYPNGAVTANEIHIPVGQAVEIKLSTVDVIHSFWVPELNVKKDQIPGMDNRLWLLADRPGRYRGQCAEYCGLQHAHMAFWVEAQPPAEYDAWVAGQAGAAAPPAAGSASAGRDIFLRSSCAGCHAVRGTSAAGTLGPDLTHVASRQTIGAGLLPTTPEAMSSFVLDAQHAKPGATMPPTEVSPQELSALTDYLMGLK